MNLGVGLVLGCETWEGVRYQWAEVQVQVQVQYVINVP